MNANSKNSDTALLAVEKIVLSILGGIAIWFIPLLQNWLVYIFWGPVLGGVFVWMYWGVRDVSADIPQWHPNPSRAFIIGLTHVIAVTIVWMLATKWLQ